LKMGSIIISIILFVVVVVVLFANDRHHTNVTAESVYNGINRLSEQLAREQENTFHTQQSVTSKPIDVGTFKIDDKNYHVYYDKEERSVFTYWEETSDPSQILPIYDELEKIAQKKHLTNIQRSTDRSTKMPKCIVKCIAVSADNVALQNRISSLRIQFEGLIRKVEHRSISIDGVTYKVYSDREYKFFYVTIPRVSKIDIQKISVNKTLASYIDNIAKRKKAKVQKVEYEMV